MRGQDFTWITEMENRNAHDVLEYKVSQRKYSRLKRNQTIAFYFNV